ncbi:hypothetical protein HYX16_06610 [Candidatus Woesearchaeota archaeon]|nr:hypothetical protein [Candidatus Woesearchaeota archaeon]
MQENFYHKKIVLKPILIGILSSFLLFGVYFSILTFANSFQHALQEFNKFWYLLLLLIFGFGTQVGFYVYIKEVIKLKELWLGSGVAATGGISTTSMAACCVHHLSDIFPILGLSAFTIIFSKYQIFWMLLGIFSNIIGITWMLMFIQKNNLYIELNRTIFSKVNMKKLFFLNLIASIFILGSALLYLRG